MAAFCEYTSFEALKACRADAADDFFEGRGKCVNNLERADRRACQLENIRNRRVTLAECEEQYEARLDVCDEVRDDIYDPPFEPEDFVDLDAKGAVENPYVSLEPGRTSGRRAGPPSLHLSDVPAITIGEAAALISPAATSSCCIGAEPATR